jgi:hypothetical protein
MDYQKLVQTVYQRVTDKLIEWNESVYFKRLYRFGTETGYHTVHEQSGVSLGKWLPGILL